AFWLLLLPTLRLEEIDPVTVKNVSNLPWVLPCLLFMIFLQPLRIRSSLTTHKFNTSEKHILLLPSSSGSFHFRSTVASFMTSGSKKRLRASLYSQSSGAGISSIEPCCLMRSMALLGPIPFIVPQ
uniref:Uncharacterized protein n=1 Tax=Cyprinus carpio carpio TaxID=630221 RepID=A0A8C0YFZ9_CYPCA